MLSGKRILDLSWVLGGPFAGQLLAQLGAEVIKVEALGGDLARRVPPVSDTQDSPFFLSVNRGKRSIALDLKSPGGKQALYDLVREADAVIYGFAPAVPARLGLDFASLSAVNPRIVVAQIIGLHDEGEWANAPAFDLMLQAMSGVMSITGEEGGKPVRVGYQVADLAGGLYLALATTAALVKALTTGRGEHVQISLYDAQVAMLTWQAQGWLCGGPVPRATGARHAMIAPSDTYLAADGKWIALAPTGEAFWRKLCETLGRPALADDPRFSDATARITHIEALTAELGALIATRGSAEWLALFAEARVPASLVHSVDEALRHPLTRARHMVEEVARPDGDTPVTMLGNPFKYGATPVLDYPPAYAADTADVLQRVAGYTPEQVAALAQAGAIGLAAQEALA
ncbi:CoA transferase [Alicycliphilus denitrificans]|uniref:CoA transferase n=1 Tax=Alicycliphilus denitrificans TaxID=179636 RepID=A0A858ZN68_9BURK|nr:CoA transferase [Alicycliphilus denitrificans]QKD42270.1 CoA transferase [Alicycliphilus denitrificans]GAO21584.1 L-carnitine dehydratase [Alicycliphilus sp. B1]GAO25871.1 L-carnitine dehydratase [Alicycliphilus sp. B1]